MCIWRPAPARGSRQRVGRLRPGERPKRRSGGDPPDTERTPPISCGRGPGADKLATKLALVPWCSRERLWEKSMQLGGERRKKGKGRANEVFFCLVAVCQLPRHWLPVQQPHHLLRDMKTIIWISFVFFFFSSDWLLFQIWFTTSWEDCTCITSLLHLETESRSRNPINRPILWKIFFSFLTYQFLRREMRESCRPECDPPWHKPQLAPERDVL